VHRTLDVCNNSRPDDASDNSADELLSLITAGAENVDAEFDAVEVFAHDPDLLGFVTRRTFSLLPAVQKHWEFVQNPVTGSCPVFRLSRELECVCEGELRADRLVRKQHIRKQSLHTLYPMSV
jgi:hypothetical protein